MDLFRASRFGILARVKYLLHTEGVDPNIVDECGVTPLHMTSFDGHLKTGEELLRAGADPNIAAKNGETPSDWATFNKHSEMIQLLETYFPSLVHLSLRSVRKFKIDISPIPNELL